MTTSRRNLPVMFRARALPGGEPLPAAAPARPDLARDAVAAPKVLLADISEFQPDINDGTYLLWSKAVIIRAAYGARHDDRAWYGGQRRDLLHAGGARFTGIYQYIVAGQDPVTQARELVRLVGALRPGEKIIGDIEEGAGNQARRRDLWAAAITHGLGDDPWIYSGLNYAAAHGLAPAEWVAAYQPAEPAAPHRLWQFTDSFQVPGVGRCDCSVFHGTIDQLAALGHQPPRPATQEDDMPSGLITSPPGTRESRTWAAGTARQIVMYSDWKGVQAAPPVVNLRIAHLDSQPYDAGHRTVDGTGTYVIGSPADCNGCAFTRIDSGPASVAWHTSA